MTYNITLTNGNAYATVNDGTIVTNTSTITLVGKNYAGYGAILDENFVHLMENSADGTAPTGAITGQLWYDTTNSLLKQYNGSLFRPITAVTSSNAAPSLTTGFGAVQGDLWYDTINAQLNVYTGNAWLVTGPAFTAAQGTSGSIVKTVNDIFLQPHTVVEFYTGGNIVGIVSQDSTFTPANAIPGFPTISPGMQLATAVNGVVPGFTAVGNITTAGNMIAGGNVYATNLFGTGFLSVAGNVYGGNLNTAGNVNATGNVNGGNIRTTGLMSATGDVIGGNFSTTGRISAVGNIYGGNIIGTIVSSGNTPITAASISLTGGITAASYTGGTFNGTQAQFDSLGVGTAATGTSGEIVATNKITSYYSDDRLKTKIADIDHALDKVMTLSGFYYTANETAVALGYEVKREVGLSAQQVQGVLPEVVSPAPIDNQYLTISYERVVPLLVEAIKELKREIDALRSAK